MRCTSASTLDPETLAGLFNEGFSEYVVPVRLSEDAFREHIANNDMIEGNDRAIALYEKLGFQLERDLIVWLLAPQERRAPEFEAAAADECCWLPPTARNFASTTHRPTTRPRVRSPNSGRIRVCGSMSCACGSADRT